MKKDDLFKYFMRNQKVYNVAEVGGSLYDQICKDFNCDFSCIYSQGIISGDYLVTDDSIGLKPNFLILYPKGHMLFFTLIE